MLLFVGYIIINSSSNNIIVGFVGGGLFVAVIREKSTMNDARIGTIRIVG